MWNCITGTSAIYKRSSILLAFSVIDLNLLKEANEEITPATGVSVARRTPSLQARTKVERVCIPWDTAVVRSYNERLLA